MAKTDAETRQQQIEELLELKAGGAIAGICGREWCELCGQPGSFTGFCGAVAAHPDGSRFVCGSCREGEFRAARSRNRTAILDELILERGFRYCGGCGRAVILYERTVEEARRRPFTCPACAGLDSGQAARRRYLEHEATKEGGLERAAARLYLAKAGIEHILEESRSSSSVGDGRDSRDGESPAPG